MSETTVLHHDEHTGNTKVPDDHDAKKESVKASATHSPLITALINVYNTKPKSASDTQKIRVSRTVSAAAFLMEKIRNSVEFRDEHYLRRAAVERILKRRLLFNPKGDEIAPYVLRELVWAKYIHNASLPESLVPEVQEIINKYLALRRYASQKSEPNLSIDPGEWLLEVASNEIEDKITDTNLRDAFVNFMFQILRTTITLDYTKGEERDAQMYIACSRALIKADTALLRYQLWKLYVPDIEKSKAKIAGSLADNITGIIRSIEHELRHPGGNKIYLYAKRQSAPFRILQDLFDMNKSHISDILATKEKRKEKIWQICAMRYSETADRLRRMAVRSIVYLFITKMLLALIVEVPLDMYFQGKIDYLPLSINTLFPPILMFFMVLGVSAPGEGNTKKIYERIEELLITVPSDAQKKMNIASKQLSSRPLQTFIFTVLYGITFFITFGLILWGLNFLNFSIGSQIIFIFFLCVVYFFGYRVRDAASEYRFEERESIFSPILDFFVLPILQVGRWLSNEVAKLNIITYFFDFLFDIPFKGMLEILEEWFSFMRNKKDEIS